MYTNYTYFLTHKLTLDLFKTLRQFNTTETVMSSAVCIIVIVHCSAYNPCVCLCIYEHRAAQTHLSDILTVELW